MPTRAHRLANLVPLAGLIAGAPVGCFGGWLLGWFLSLDYRKPAYPGDPMDAPAMLTLFLMALGACVVAVAGLFIGVIIHLRLWRKLDDADPSREVGTA